MWSWLFSVESWYEPHESHLHLGRWAGWDGVVCALASPADFCFFLCQFIIQIIIVRLDPFWERSRLLSWESELCSSSNRLVIMTSLLMRLCSATLIWIFTVWKKIYPRKLTWIPKIMVWKRWFLLNMAILGIYVKFLGCTLNTLLETNSKSTGILLGPSLFFQGRIVDFRECTATSLSSKHQSSQDMTGGFWKTRDSFMESYKGQIGKSLWIQSYLLRRYSTFAPKLYPNSRAFRPQRILGSIGLMAEIRLTSWGW